MELEDVLIVLLQSGPMLKATLIKMAQERTQRTAQGIYKAIRSLREKEVITVQRNSISLSLTWMDEQLNRFQAAIQKYQEKIGNDVVNLGPGEARTFKFRTLRELDTFWVDTFLLIESRTVADVPMYVIIPHDWFSRLRPRTDRAWVRRMKKERNQGIVITHALPFDKKISAERSTKQLEFVFNQNPLNSDERRYINIVSPWIFEATIDAKANEVLVDWMRHHEETAKTDMDKLNLLAELPGSYLLKITNSPSRSTKIIKKIERYFTFTL